MKFARVFYCMLLGKSSCVNVTTITSVPWRKGAGHNTCSMSDHTPCVVWQDSSNHTLNADDLWTSQACLSSLHPYQNQLWNRPIRCSSPLREQKLVILFPHCNTYSMGHILYTGVKSSHWTKSSSGTWVHHKHRRRNGMSHCCVDRAVLLTGSRTSKRSRKHTPWGRLWRCITHS